MENDAPGFDLEERLLEYAANIVRITELVRRTPAGTHVANQLLRSGTSPLPNHGEAQAAESVDDFVHKLSVCLKELRETRRELIRIFYSSIATAKKRKPRKPSSDES